MTKDHIRDYATDAFRFYARWGGKDNYIKALLADLQRQKGNGVCFPTEAALVHKEQIMKEKHAEIADLDAVEMVLQICDRDTCRAIEHVYFKDCDKELEWGDITRRVHYAEIHIPASQAQIYRWLKKARILFAEERGLRTKMIVNSPF